MFLPFRTKNPPEHVPYVTYALIIINSVVFLLTANFSDGWPEIKKGVMHDWAVSYVHFTPLRLFTSLFLHMDPVHLIGNMLFLWIFGAAAEGRLRALKFTAMYLIAGIVGGILQTLIMAHIAPHMYGLGASGAIMGLAGAYVWMFPHSTICFIYWTRLLPRYGEWPAWGVVTYYVGFDLLYGFIFQGRDGVGHFAHIGGFVSGLLATMAMRPHRDDHMVSEVQATRANMSGDLELMSCNELNTLMQRPTDNMTLLMTFCKKALTQPGANGEKRALEVLNAHKEFLLASPDHDAIARLVLRVPKDTGGLPGPFYLKLGGKLEGEHNYDQAALIYRRIFDLYPTSPDAPAALLRFGRIFETFYQNPDMAKDSYEVFMKMFPTHPMAEEAEKGLQRLGGPTTKVAIMRQATIQKLTIVDDDEPEMPPTQHTYIDTPEKQEEKFEMPNPFG